MRTSHGKRLLLALREDALERRPLDLGKVQVLGQEFDLVVNTGALVTGDRPACRLGLARLPCGNKCAWCQDGQRASKSYKG